MPYCEYTMAYLIISLSDLFHSNFLYFISNAVIKILVLKS